MSVMMGLRLEVDRDAFERAITGDPDRLAKIAARSKEHGAIHHRFFASVDGTMVLVVDEWPDPESFQRFFEASPEIGEMMGEAGLRNEPAPDFWVELDTPDKF